MSKILVVGIATLDVINIVESYPNEDAEVRASKQRIKRGGNAANTAIVLAKLGSDTTWFGTLADDQFSGIITTEFQEQGINFAGAPTIPDSTTPTSYITVSNKTGSRTIVHYRNLRELQESDFESIKLEEYEWIHFEGRNELCSEAVLKSITRLEKRPIISIEIEKRRGNETKLFPYADLLIFARHYVNASTESNLKIFTEEHNLKPHQTAIFPQAERGTWLFNNESINWIPATHVNNPVDTVGAGDTFNAAIIHAKSSGISWNAAIVYANCIAAKKVMQHGFNHITKNMCELNEI